MRKKVVMCREKVVNYLILSAFLLFSNVHGSASLNGGTEISIVGLTEFYEDPIGNRNKTLQKVDYSKCVAIINNMLPHPGLPFALLPNGKIKISGDKKVSFKANTEGFLEKDKIDSYMINFHSGKKKENYLIGRNATQDTVGSAHIVFPNNHAILMEIQNAQCIVKNVYLRNGTSSPEPYLDIALCKKIDDMINKPRTASGLNVRHCLRSNKSSDPVIRMKTSRLNCRSINKQAALMFSFYNEVAFPWGKATGTALDGMDKDVYQSTKDKSLTEITPPYHIGIEKLNALNAAHIIHQRCHEMLALYFLDSKVWEKTNTYTYKGKIFKWGWWDNDWRLDSRNPSFNKYKGILSNDDN